MVVCEWMKRDRVRSNLPPDKTLKNVTLRGKTDGECSALDSTLAYPTLLAGRLCCPGSYLLVISVCGGWERVRDIILCVCVCAAAADQATDSREGSH